MARFLLLILLLTAFSGEVISAEIAVEAAFPHLSFHKPVDIQHAPDQTNRLFVVEQPGRIVVFPNSRESKTAALFLDIQDRVNDSGAEEGLLGLAFHPHFKINGYFYVDYTAENPRRTVISRFRVFHDNPNRADKKSETIILEVLQPYSNHNGGQIAFGPDGHLYIALGDGGSGGDPQGHGQNLKTLLGSILRIDVNRPAGGKAYGIPLDNPFVGNKLGYREEIYAWGLRNPWRFSFDPITDRLWAADVGQDEIEEVDLIEKGKNYGWNIFEGTKCFSGGEKCKVGGFEMPVAEYDHRLGRTVTGGFVYRGKRMPTLFGKYIYADFESGRIWELIYAGKNQATVEEILKADINISSFGVDESQELYLCGYTDGKIYWFVPGR